MILPSPQYPIINNFICGLFVTSPDIWVVRSGGGSHDIAFPAAHVLYMYIYTVNMHHPDLRLANCDTLLDSTPIAMIFTLNGP